MQTVLRALRFSLLMFFAAFMGACSTTSGDKANQESRHEQLYKEALQALSTGERDKGLQLLDASARANPTYVEPWVKAAQVHFEAANYPMAIKAADEAMKRDPARRETKAIAVVASLRVAIAALGDMREDANLRGNTRTEAEQLARTLRETLSIEVLVPTAVAPASKVATPASGASAVTPATSPTPAVAAPAAAPAPSRPAARPTPVRRTEPVQPAARPEAAPSSGGNPFNVLK
jgi:hypothetical protein